MGNACVKSPAFPGSQVGTVLHPDQEREEAVPTENSVSTEQPTAHHAQPNVSKENLVHRILPPKNKSFIPFLKTSWPGSILKWTDHDIETFAACFTPHHVKEGKEVSDC